VSDWRLCRLRLQIQLLTVSVRKSGTDYARTLDTSIVTTLCPLIQSRNSPGGAHTRQNLSASKAEGGSHIEHRWPLAEGNLST
jgi:hypothetical protein